MVEVVKYLATGRRKTSVAQATITPGSGKLVVNGRMFEDYFPRETDRILVLSPLKFVNLLNKFDICVIVKGGGLTGQAGAIKLALSRSLVLFDQANKTILRKNVCLTRDSRMKERKKPGQKGARRKFQWVKR